MARLLQGDACQSAFAAAGELQGKLEEPDHSSSNWYFSREHIEKNSLSRRDGIDLKKETVLRKSYCTFVQDLGMRLKVPQVTIATAIVFCHRFFLRQSHEKNDRFMIATVCMFLAGKVEETPVLLQTVICVSYEIRHKKDPTAVQRIKQKDVYEKEKELVLLGERLVLTTLGFDLNIHHPYKPLVSAIKKFKVAQNALAQVAWNFINDGLRTSLCLQFKPHHVAAGAIFLAAKFLKVKLPSNGEKLWWQEFDVTPRQLEEVSNQMLELYEQNRGLSASRSGDFGASSAGTHNEKVAATSEAPPGTPQVEERRSGLEATNHAKKASLVGLEEVNIDKVKTAMEKRRKVRLEGGEKYAKPKLTDEEELLEKEMEYGQGDALSEKEHNQVHTDEHPRGSCAESSVIMHLKREHMEEEQAMEVDAGAGLRSGSVGSKFRHVHNRDHHSHYTQDQRRVDMNADHYQQHRDTDRQEKDIKRARYEHIK